MDKFLTDERVNAFRAQLRDDASYTEVADTTRRANIRRINTYHRGLRRLVCYVYAWIEQQGCFPRGSPNVWKTCFLFYAFGLRLLPQQVDAAFLEIVSSANAFAYRTRIRGLRNFSRQKVQRAAKIPSTS